MTRGSHAAPHNYVPAGFRTFSRMQRGEESNSPGPCGSSRRSLDTPNSQGLPFTLPPDGNLKADLTGEVITLTAPKTMMMVTSFLFNDNGHIFPESDTGIGTYTFDGSKVTLTFSDGTIYTATISDNKMTLYDPDPSINLTFVYRRN